MQSAMTFSEWLTTELYKRGWSRSEAARRGKISASMFDKVINGHSQPGMRFIQGIALAFGMTPAEVMTYTKLSRKKDLLIDRIMEIIGDLPEEDQSEILEYARLRRRIAEERGKYETNKGTTRDTSKP